MESNVSFLILGIAGLMVFLGYFWEKYNEKKLKKQCYEELEREILKTGSNHGFLV